MNGAVRCVALPRHAARSGAVRGAAVIDAWRREAMLREALTRGERSVE